MLTATACLSADAAALRSGELLLPDYVERLCNRIDAVDPLILALLPEPARHERLLAEAAEIERRFPSPAERPLLYGVPVAVKDIFSVDGFVTRAGSALPPELFEQWFAGREASSVTRLREAGALLLGKTVSTEFAHFEPGATRNPHDREHTPGGSSSGSAAAVAAGFAPLALGSQTVGSVIRPAAFCGVVGFKPSYDRIPIDGVLGYSRSADHVGLFAQDAAGMALAASAVLDGWQPPGGAPDGAARDGPTPVLGVPEGRYLEQAEPEALRAFEGQLARLQQAGCEVRHVAALDDIKAIDGRHRAMTAAEFAEVHDSWFTHYGALYRPLSAALVERGRAVSAGAREAGRRGRAELRERLHELMQANGLDAWVCPAAPGPAPKGIGSTGSPAMNLPWTHSGLPALTLPAGRAENGLPLGIQLSARFMADERLLTWAETLEPVLATGGG